MSELAAAIAATLSHFDFRSVIDILVVAFLLYWVLVLLQGTTAITLLRAIVSVYLVGFLVSSVFQLTMVSWLLRNSLPAMLVAIPILFQPEFRRVLEQVGRGFAGWRGMSASQATLDTVDAVARACHALAQSRIGALVVLERETGLQDYIDRGIKLDAVVSPDLLVGLFQPNSPLHDGAVILRRGRVVAARCPLPMSDNAGEHLNRGMRHRAAMGISERTDAIAVAVSEERGSVSVATNGHMVTQAMMADPDALKAFLLNYYAPPRPPSKNGRGKGVGVKSA